MNENMQRFIKFNSIKQYNDAVKDVTHHARYQGYDEVKQEPIYDHMTSLPKLKVIGSEKIHGTNAGVCFNNKAGFWVQSKNNIITPEKDNAKCAEEAMKYKEDWMEIIHLLAEYHEIDLDTHIVSVFYEWAGGNIQTNSACSGMDKRAIIFQHFKVSPLEPQVGEDGEEESTFWLETMAEDVLCEGEFGVASIDRPFSNIYNIMNFPTWEFEIDFNQPKMIHNSLLKVVLEEVEPASPLGKTMGKCENIGEGIVCTFTYKDVLYKFKVKGDKHSKSKVKTLKPVDEAKEQAKQELAQAVTPAWRLEQMYAEVFDTLNGGTGDKKRTGDFMKALSGDVIKEELDNINEAGFEVKEIMPYVNKIGKTWFFEELNREVGL